MLLRTWKDLSHRTRVTAQQCQGLSGQDSQEREPSLAQMVLSLPVPQQQVGSPGFPDVFWVSQSQNSALEEGILSAAVALGVHSLAPWEALPQAVEFPFYFVLPMCSLKDTEGINFMIQLPRQSLAVPCAPAGRNTPGKGQQPRLG